MEAKIVAFGCKVSNEELEPFLRVQRRAISSRLELYDRVPRLQVNVTDFFHNVIWLSLIMRLLTSVHIPVFDPRNTFDCISVDPGANSGTRGIIVSEEDSSGQALAVSQEFHRDAEPKSRRAVGERIAP
jgi:hypothetical protein